MEGGRPTIPITLCGNCDESSNNDGLFKQFVSSINVDYRDYNKIVIEDEDDEPPPQTPRKRPHNNSSSSSKSPTSKNMGSSNKKQKRD